MPSKSTAKKPRTVRRGASKVKKAREVAKKLFPEKLREEDDGKPNLEELGITSSSSQEKIETLLPCEQRKELPQIPQQSGSGRKCLLYDIIQHSPDQYARIIQLIRQGVSLNVAATRLDIGERTFYDWGARGAEDAANDLDTYFSRFWKDVRRAIATMASECEQDVAKKNPSRWLALGAGRIFGNRWNERKDGPKNTGSTSARLTHGHSSPGQFQPAAPQEIDQVIEGTFAQNPSTLALPQIEGPNDGNTEGVDQDPQVRNSGATTDPGSTLQLTPQDEYQALKVLEDIGCITMSDEFARAYEDQLGITDPNKEDDHEEGE